MNNNNISSVSVYDNNESYSENDSENDSGNDSENLFSESEFDPDLESGLLIDNNYVLPNLEISVVIIF